MEPAHLTRLREEQDKAIVETDEKIAQWAEMKSNYQSLQDKLKTLSHKVSHDIMVPFGPCAFIPGKMIHTNEITVLLGDNWFIERSAHQAAEIAGRRIHSIDKSISDLDEQKKLLQPRVDITSQLQNIAEEKDGVREIREEYDSDEDRLWREKHRKSVHAHKKKLKEEQEKLEVKKEEKTELSQEELWARLDELEEIENRRQEVQRLRPEVNPSIVSFVQMQPNIEEPIKDAVSNKHIQWQDSQSDDSYDEDSEDENPGSSSQSRITFSHTSESSSKYMPTVSSDESNASTDASNADISSPADIYTLFGHLTEPKSILKKNSKKQFIRKAREAQIEDSRSHPVNIKKIPDAAFTGTILEKSSATQSAATMPIPIYKSTEDYRPVSKFRAARLKQNER